MVTAYLDTCIISGIAKGDIAQVELDGLLEILKAHRSGIIQLVTSNVTGRELEAIPQEYRQKHEFIYNLLGAIPLAQHFNMSGSLMLMGAGGGRTQDPLGVRLRKVIPDEGDVDHVFQAAKNSVPFLLTVDVKTLVRYALEIQEVCGVKVRLPTQFLLEPCMKEAGISP